MCLKPFISSIYSQKYSCISQFITENHCLILSGYIIIADHKHALLLVDTANICSISTYWRY